MYAGSTPTWLEGGNGKKELRASDANQELRMGLWAVGRTRVEAERLPWSISGTEACGKGSQVAESPVRRLLQMWLVERRASVRAWVKEKLSW